MTASGLPSNDAITCNKCGSIDTTYMSDILFCMSCGHKITTQYIINSTSNNNDHSMVDDGGGNKDQNNENHSLSSSTVTPDKSNSIELPSLDNAAADHSHTTNNKYKPSCIIVSTEQPTPESDINSVNDKLTLDSSPLDFDTAVVVQHNDNSDVQQTPNKPKLTVNVHTYSSEKKVGKTPRQVTPKTSILSPDSTNSQSNTYHMNNEQLVTMTKHQYEQLISGIQQESISQSHTELQLLSSEIDALHIQLQQCNDEKLELTQLTEHAVNQYETTLQQSIHYKADLDVLQHELTTSRAQYDKLQLDYNSMSNELQAVLIQYDNTAANERTINDTLKNLQSQYNTLQQQFNELSDQAHDKLSEGARVYSIEVNKVIQLTTERDGIQNDMKRLQLQCNEYKQRLQLTDTRCQSLQHDNDRLLTDHEQINDQSTQLKLQIEQLYGELNELQRMSDESSRTSKVYRDQIIEYKDKIRQLENDNKSVYSVAQQSQSITIELDSLRQQNNTLKAQLFDQMNNTNNSDTKQLLQQINLLTSELNNKTNELTELSAVLQPLIDEVEQLREKHGITN